MSKHTGRVRPGTNSMPRTERPASAKREPAKVGRVLNLGTLHKGIAMTHTALPRKGGR